MYRKIKLICLIAIFLALNLNYTSVLAQLTLTGQLRPRGEIRKGFANLLPENADLSSFVSQRTRLNFGYKWDRLTFGATVQDVRVWGQDASTISNADGNKLMLHEGWAEVTLANKADTTVRFKLLDNLSFKVGRQELIYDDSRLIGNLDWLQQGRRFEMILLKAVHHGWQVDMGYAFNQNAENFSGIQYVPGNVPQFVKNDIGVLVPTPSNIVPLVNASGNSSATGNPLFANPPGTNGANQDYKNFTSIYVTKKINQTKVALLYFQDEFAKYRVGSIAAGEGRVFGRIFDLQGTNNRYTYGGMINPVFGNATGFGKIALQGAYYQQEGKDRDGRNLKAYHYTLFASYTKGKFTLGPGYDYLSGNKTTTIGSESKRFDPLYGTPHKFWGIMDYFYAPTGSPASGLKNFYFKTKFTANQFYITADYHKFFAANVLANLSTKELADEVDLAINHNLNKFTSLELGYSVLKGTDALPIAKAQPSANIYNKTGQFGYLMINIKPDFLYTKPVAIK